MLLGNWIAWSVTMYAHFVEVLCSKCYERQYAHQCQDREEKHRESLSRASKHVVVEVDGFWVQKRGLDDHLILDTSQSKWLSFPSQRQRCKDCQVE